MVFVSERCVVWNSTRGKNDVCEWKMRCLELYQRQKWCLWVKDALSRTLPEAKMVSWSENCLEPHTHTQMCCPGTVPEEVQQHQFTIHGTEKITVQISGQRSAWWERHHPGRDWRHWFQTPWQVCVCGWQCHFDVGGQTQAQILETDHRFVPIF